MTAATRAGSSPLSCDCWRMMSSWRSGSVISCTACLSGCMPIRTTPPMIPMRTAATRTRRRRTLAARQAAGLGRRLLVALAVAILSQLLNHFRQLDLQLFKRPVVADDKVRFLRLFVLAQLTRSALGNSGMATSARALGADVLVGDDRDGLVEHGFHSSLEQERHFDDSGRPSFNLFPELGHPSPHHGPQDAFEPLT